MSTSIRLLAGGALLLVASATASAATAATTAGLACVEYSSVIGCESARDALSMVQRQLAEAQPHSERPLCAHHNPGFRYFLTHCDRPKLILAKYAVYSGSEPDPDKNSGDSCKADKSGNPISHGTGNKFQHELDFSGAGEFPLRFARAYNSLAEVQQPSSAQMWRHNYEMAVVVTRAAVSGARVYRPDGKAYVYMLRNGAWVGDADVPHRLDELFNAQGVHSGWRYTLADDQVETYDVAGRLLQIRRRDGLQQTLRYSDAGTPTSIAPRPGLLIEVSDPQGRALRFRYNAQARLVAMVAPDGGEYRYTHTGRGDISSVTYPDGRARRYLYTEAGLAEPGKLRALTGIIDEHGSRLATFAYDAQGRGILTEYAGGAGRYTFSYSRSGATPTATRVTTPTGLQFTAALSLAHGKVQCRGRDVGSEGDARERTYDQRGNPDLRTDFAGVTSDSDYNARGLLVRHVESANQPATRRTTETDWHPDLAVPTERRVIDAAQNLVGLQRWTYNPRGQVLSHSVIDPASAAARTTRYRYCEAEDVQPGSACPRIGLLAEVDGPRDDVADITRYAYRSDDAPGCADNPATCAWRKGDLHTITNALGQVSEILAYDGAGRVLAQRDANGVRTDMAYHPRGWLLQRSVRGADPASTEDDAITRIDYTASGQVQRVTQPDGDWLAYEYDAAHLLVAIVDAQGNRIDYTLDAEGKRTAETTRDSDGAIVRQLARVYDEFGRLALALDALGRVVAEQDYDAAGRLALHVDAQGSETREVHDPLGRLRQTIQDYTGIAAETSFDYDAEDRLTRVVDPKGLSTEYRYNGLGDLLELRSPDTGLTTYRYDAAGNRIEQTDARGVLTRYDYDALNRLTRVRFADGSQDVSYTYDQVHLPAGCRGSFPVGRLGRVVDPSGSTAYCYDRQGQVTAKIQTTDTLTLATHYRYTLGGRLLSVTYPSGNVVDYDRDALGRIERVRRETPAAAAITRTAPSSALPPAPVVAGTRYAAFGPPTTIEFGGGTTLDLSRDANGAIVGVNSPALAIEYTTNARGEVLSISDDWQVRRYGYDSLSRLVDVSDAAGTRVEGFTYDATGNRLSKEGEAGVSTYGYAADSHQLTEVGGSVRRHDAAGSLIDRGDGWTYEYTARQRLHRVKYGSSVVQTNAYNAKGERVAKTIGAGPHAGHTVVFSYGEAGHLLAEYRRLPNGTTVLENEYIWLDDVPVAVAVGSPPEQRLFHVHSDHLGTPRALTDALDGQVVWRWSLAGSAFGEHAPEGSADSKSAGVEFNLRYPGQYFDQESGLHYNGRRDYDPVTGRYVESDPIGLRGGLNTYSYVRANPLGGIDPSGLLRIGASCESRRAQIEEAERQVRKKLEECSGQCAAGGTSCVKCENVERLKQKLDRSIVDCKTTWAGEECGYGDLNGWHINISEAGFMPKRCGCLAATIFHEITHNIGIDHPGDAADQSDEVNSTTNRCFPCALPTR